MKIIPFLIPVLLMAGCIGPSTTAGRAELGTVRGNLVDIHSHLSKPVPTADDIKTADQEAVSSIPLIDAGSKALVAAEEFYREWKDAVLGPWTWKRIYWAIGVIGCIVIGFILLDLSGAPWLAPAVAGAMRVGGHLMSAGLALLYKFVKRASVSIAKVTGSAAAKAAPMLAKMAPTPPPAPTQGTQ